MDIPKIYEGEYRFSLIMWEHEPITPVQVTVYDLGFHQVYSLSGYTFHKVAGSHFPVVITLDAGGAG